jgi:hypothetical protein
VKNHFKLPTTFWGGFSEGRLDLDHFVSGGGKVYGVLYLTRAKARECYQDVRKVEVREAKRRRSAGTEKR